MQSKYTIILTFLFCCFYPGALFASQDEVLEIRRIAACYQEKDYPLSIDLIQQFMHQHPNSHFSENIYLLLADIYLDSKDWKKALATYNLIQTPALKKDCQIQKLHCLYQLELYDELKKNTEKMLANATSSNPRNCEIARFYLAESLLKSKSSCSHSELKQAKGLYLQLLGGSFASYAKAGLAAIYHRSGESKQAAALFHEVSKLNPKDEEKYLFASACDQAQYDITAAADTFEIVKNMNASFKEAALYNWLVLLYRSAEDQKIIDVKDELLKGVSKEQKAQTEFLIGKSFYRLKRYNEAIDKLKQVKDSLEDKEDLKEAHLLGVIASSHVKDTAAIELFSSYIEKLYNKELIHAEALYWKGRMWQQLNHFSKAVTAYQKAVKVGFDEISPLALYQTGLIFFSQNQFLKAADTFLNLITQYPQSSYCKLSASHLIRCGQCHYKEKKNPRAKQLLCTAYSTALKIPRFFSQDQLFVTHLILAKLHLDLSQWCELDQSIELLLRSFGDHEKIYQVYLLKAASLEKQNLIGKSYIDSLEEALLKAPDGDISKSVLEDLFYAYLKMIKADSSFEKYMSELAKVVNQLISIDYKFNSKTFKWICQGFCLELKKKCSSSHSLLQSIKPLLTHYATAHYQPGSSLDHLLMLNTVKTCFSLQDYNTAVELASKLEQEPNLKSTLLYDLLLYKATCLLKLEKNQKAAQSLKYLLSHCAGLSRIQILKAKFALAKAISYQLTERLDTNLIEEATTLLRSITTAREWNLEPTCLQAAVDLALLENLNSLTCGHFDSCLNALEVIKESYLDHNSLSMKEYHELKERDSVKRPIVDQYMTYLDAKIYQLRSATSKTDVKKQHFYENQSQQLINELLRETKCGYLKSICELETQRCKQQSNCELNYLAPLYGKLNDVL